MKLHTAAEVISFAKTLEDESTEFYENLSQRYPKDKDVFLSFAKENEKYVTQFQRAYYSVITDAIESCFAFDIETDEYTFTTELSEKANYSAALTRALEIERKIIKFYSDAAEQSGSLMADVPRAFALIAKKMGSREQQLRSLLEREG